MTGPGPVDWFGTGGCGCPNLLEHLASCRGDHDHPVGEVEEVSWLRVERDDDGNFQRFSRRPIRRLR